MKPILKKSLVVLAVPGLLVSVVAGRERLSLSVVEPAARIEARIQLGDELDLAKLERPAHEAAKGDPFARRSFGAAAPAERPAAPQPPAKPTAPPLPFRYVGKVIDGDQLTVFLARDNENFSVAAGATIGGEYRVDAVTDNEITFTYLPLKTKHSLPL